MRQHGVLWMRKSENTKRKYEGKAFELQVYERSAIENKQPERAYQARTDEKQVNIGG